MKNYTKSLIGTAVLATFMASCKSDSPDLAAFATDIEKVEVDFQVPATYEFTRNGSSTVNFEGQTTRLSMAKEIVGYFNVNSGKTASEIEAAFNHQTGGQDFVDTALNGESKNVKSKVAASADLFQNDAVSKQAIQAIFSSYITKHVAEIVPNKLVDATAGNPGKIGVRYVNGKGLEYNQAFNKALIGALNVDQVLNNYLGTTYTTNSTTKQNNTDLILVEGQNYTAFEHYFDEAYGYVYGDNTVNSVSPSTKEGDKFLFNYITTVNADPDFSNIQSQIFKAFKIGRAAIVAKNYDALDKAIDVIQYQISRVIAIRAVFYLQDGKRALALDNNESAFHGLSEAYGFIVSLQFTRNPKTDLPYFTKAEVDAMIAKLEAGNGFWDLKDGKVLDALSKEIVAKFDFTLAQAAE